MHRDDIEETVGEIRLLHRRRCFAMTQRIAADHALRCFVEGEFGWRKSMADADKAKIKARVKAVLDIGEKLAVGKDVEITDDYESVCQVVESALMARGPMTEIEVNSSKSMVELAKTLPVYSWWQGNVFKDGAISLAVIIGEAGDLSQYSNPGKLWKRMGLAVIDGVRQGGLTKGAAAEDWIEHGYNRVRRSRMFVIGDTLIKNPGGKYRQVYLERKAYEQAKAKEMGLIVAPSAKIPAKRKSEFISDGHIHRRSQRYMEKRLLKNVWQAWRRQAVTDGDYHLDITSEAA